MKLHHFINAKVTDAGSRVRDLGKALTISQPVIQSSSDEVVEPVAEASKKVMAPGNEIQGDLKQAIRDYAEEQCSRTSPHVHRKIRHYD